MISDLPLGLQATIRHQEGAVARRQLLAAGLSEDVARVRIAHGRWQRSGRPAVYVCDAGRLHRETELWAALLYAGQNAVLSHDTAAEIWEVVEQPDPAEPIHVTIPAERRLASQPGIRIHRSTRIDQKSHPARSLPVTRVEETVLDLIDRAARFRDVVGWVTRTCRTWRTTPPLLRAAVSQRSRLRWRRPLNTLLDEVTDGVSSPLEGIYLRRVERAHGLPLGSRQRRRIVGSATQWIDVAYEEFRLIVELDGRLGHEADLFRDRRRDNISTVRGFDTLRYGWEDTAEGGCTVAGEVALVLQRQGATGMAGRTHAARTGVHPDGRRPGLMSPAETGAAGRNAPGHRAIHALRSRRQDQHPQQGGRPMAWIMWIVIAVGLGIAELFTLTFDLALLAGAALIAAGAAALGVPTGLSFVVFAVMAAVLLGAVRPMIRRYMEVRPPMPSGVQALVGKEGLVLNEVSRTAGLVKIGGEEWTARPYDATLVIPAGSTVHVFAIEGATALVHPQEEETWASNL